MVGIADQHLERMGPGRQLDPRLGLAAAEMQVVLVIGDRLVQRRKVAVDDQVVVPGVVPADTRRSHPEVLKTHPDPELSAIDHGAVGRPDDIGPRILGRLPRFGGVSGWTVAASCAWTVAGMATTARAGAQVRRRAAMRTIISTSPAVAS